MLAGPPDGDIELPRIVHDVADGRDVRVVWRNELGGLTFEIGRDDERSFVKWAPSGSGLDCAAEAERMLWVAPFSRVPKVQGFGSDQAGSWLITAPLCGESAVSDRWREDPA